QSDCRIDITDNRIRKRLGIDLAPGHGFRWRCSGQTACVRTSVGNLNEIVMSGFFYYQDFLNLRFGLQHEVLGRAAAGDEDSALAAASFGVKNNCGRLVYVEADIEFWSLAI